MDPTAQTLKVGGWPRPWACPAAAGRASWPLREPASRFGRRRKNSPVRPAGAVMLREPASPFGRRRGPAAVSLDLMSDVTRILSAIEQGDPSAAEQLLPLVYDELRKLAAQKLAQERPGQTLQATALIHEAYLRLVDAEQAQRWDGRGH